MRVLAIDFPTFTALRRHFSSVNSTMFNEARIICKEVPIFAVLFFFFF